MLFFFKILVQIFGLPADVKTILTFSLIIISIIFSISGYNNGTFTPNELFVVRQGCPLMIGLGEHENIVASDINSILSHTQDIIYLEDEEMGIISKEKVTIKTITGKAKKKTPQHISWNPKQAQKDGHDHFMLKEIHEQPNVIRNIISKYKS